MWRHDNLINQRATMKNIRTRLAKVVKGSWKDHGGPKFPEAFSDGYCLKRCQVTFYKRSHPMRVTPLARYVMLQFISLKLVVSDMSIDYTPHVGPASLSMLNIIIENCA